jgi:probable O-glycosylation ligase (exosortase A-associated)
VRDIVLTLVVLASLPVCVARPWIGVLVFSWLSYMNPHRLTWGFAFDQPFAQLAALATLTGLAFSRETNRFPWSPTVIVWLALLAWMGITTIFALDPSEATTGLSKVAKIQLMVFVTLYVMGTKERMNALVWVIATSIAFYGVKGGIFALTTGGQYRVWGPFGTFIEDNNSIGLALVMTLPLLRFLQVTATEKWIKLALFAGMALTALATLSTQSRGAFVGLCAMTVFLWLKSKNKIVFGMILIVAAPTAFLMMPETWHQRMETIETYEQDSSAVGRLNAWKFTVLLANQRITGGGMGGIEDEEVYRTYAPDLHVELLSTGGAFRAAHSIWFGMLGQHGWIGFALFVLLGFLSWRNGSWVIAKTKGRPELRWHNELARMLQVAIIGYAATGTFLSMEYFDYYYHVLALLLLLRFEVERELTAQHAALADGARSVLGPSGAPRDVARPGLAFVRPFMRVDRSKR